MRFSLLLTCVLFITACSPASNQPTNNTQEQQDSGTTLAEARSQEQATLKVLYVPAEGFAYHNEQGQLTGVTVELMRDFVTWVERYNRMQISLEFVEDTDWNRFYQRVEQAEGGVFGLGNVTITEARQEQLQFSPPYLYNVAVLISPSETATLQQWQDFPQVFADLSPLAFAGTLHETRIQTLRDRYHSDSELGRVQSNAQVIELVESGDYYSYIDAYNYWRAIEQGAAIKHHPIADEHGETFGIITPHSNDWTTLLNAFFAASGGYTQTDEYLQHLRQHLGAELADTLNQARIDAAN